MKLLQKIAQSFSLARSVPGDISPVSQIWLRGGEEEDLYSSKLTAPYSQSAWIYVAVSVLGETVASIPFRLSRGKGKERMLVDSGPVYDLFQRPHPSMSRALFWQTIVSWDALRGEFFVAPLDARGQPVALGLRQPQRPIHLLPLCPDSFAHMLNGHELVGWKYLGADPSSPLANQVLLPEEVIFSRNFNPYSFWRGLSPLRVASLPAEGDYAAEQFMKGLMVNNGDAGLIVTTDDMMDEIQREQLLASLNNRKRRAGTADRPLFLWGKGMKIEKPAVSSADLQFLENRKLNRQEIGAIFKVPESMMGFSGQKNMLSGGAAIEQDRLSFVESTISALCRRLETALEPLIKSFDSTLDGWFDVESLPIMQAARRERMLTAQKAFAMGVPFNEINQVYDLGFESLPWGNKGYVDGALHEVGSKDPEKGRGKEPVALENAEGSIQKFLELLENGGSGSVNGDRAKAATGKLRKFFFEQRGRVLERLGRSADWQPAESRIVNPPGAISNELFNLEEENQCMLEGMKSLTDRADLLNTINQATYEAISAAIKESSSAQESKSGVAERVKGVFNKLSSRAEEIADWLMLEK